MDPLYSDDDDLLEEQYERKRQAAERKSLNIRGPGGEKLPDELNQALADYIDNTRASAEAVTPIEFRATASMLDYFSRMDSFLRPGPAMLAMCEILDEMTEGYFYTLVRYHETRRVIMWTKNNIASVRQIMSIIDIAAEHATYIKEIWLFFDIYLDYLYFTYESAVAMYRELSEWCGKEVDETFIETGYVSERSYWERAVFGSPLAYKDELE
jgi:hypothetical protein